eukprot:3132689-Heterocapsa_arctica.AAC.1
MDFASSLLAQELLIVVSHAVPASGRLIQREYPSRLYFTYLDPGRTSQFPFHLFLDSRYQFNWDMIGQ